MTVPPPADRERSSRAAAARLFLDNRPILFLILLLQTAAVALVALALLPFHNTLENNGRWVMTKTQMEMGLVGAEMVGGGPQALAGNQLDLSVWHGHHEAVYKDLLTLERVEFDFFISTNAYFCFVFNKDPETFSAVRFSANPDYPGAYITARDEGDFIAKSPLPAPGLKIGEWNRLKALFARDGLSLELNGLPTAFLPGPPMAGRQIGFRSGRNKVLVDNVEAYGPGSERIFEERFSGNALLFPLGASAAWKFMAVNLVLFFAALARGTTFRRALLGISTFSLVALLSSFLFFVYCSFRADRYPHPRDLFGPWSSKRDEIWLLDAVKRVRTELQSRYPGGPARDTVRVLFIGTSQTWGCGARVEAETYLRRLETMLNGHYAGSKKVECLNTGIQGAHAAVLFSNYERHWIGHKPSITVINLSSNDWWGPDQFREQLGRFITLNKSRGIKTYLVLEPESTEHSPGDLPTHEAMRKAGREYGVPLFEMHDYLRKRKDEGFLWWDYVHPTSFGHRLIAEALFGPLRSLIDAGGPAPRKS